MEMIRNPKQKRAIDKKNKILEAGFKIICEKGYYNITTQDIAKEADVSTGIIYQYFEDKHDIFIQSLNLYADKIFYPSINLDTKITKDNIRDVIDNIISLFLRNHQTANLAHEEIMSMVHIDKEVAYYYYKREMDLTNDLYNLLVKNMFKDENLKEKVHISLGMIDNFCHEVTYHKHDELDYTKMKEIIISMIEKIIKGE